jgi:glyoxylase-like metal-dependent hydrolase (beta-lactamase superfamily II)
MKMKKIMLAALGLALATPAAGQHAGHDAPLHLWRLDCGSIKVSDFDVFSDTYLYEGKPKELTASCYLIHNGDRYMIWDTGVAGPAKEWVFDITLKERVVDQLKRLNLKPSDINFVGISHYHDDHTGQAKDFPNATLLMGTGDWEAVKGRPEIAARFTPWISGGSKVEPVARDKDVFGDGRVVILDMPGHTPGHKALLVRLKSGPVLLTGDLYHATEQVPNRGVPSFNTNRADTLASFDRFQAIAKSLGAKVIIQHEINDIAKLPAFPKPAE